MPTLIFLRFDFRRIPGRFAPITCSPRKVSRFAPLNRYYIIIDEVFFDNFLIIIYLSIVYKKNNNIKNIYIYIYIYDKQRRNTKKQCTCVE